MDGREHPGNDHSVNIGISQCRSDNYKPWNPWII